MQMSPFKAKEVVEFWIPHSLLFPYLLQSFALELVSVLVIIHSVVEQW